MIDPDEANPYAPPRAERSEASATEIRLGGLGSAEAVMKEQLRVQTTLRIMARTWGQLGWASIAFAFCAAITAAQYPAIGPFSVLPGLVIAPFLFVAAFSLKRFRPWAPTVAIVAVWVVWIMLAIQAGVGWYVGLALLDARFFAPPVVDNAVGIAAIASGLILAAGPLTLMDQFAGRGPRRFTRAGEALLPLATLAAIVIAEGAAQRFWVTQSILTASATFTGLIAARFIRFFEAPATRQAFSPEERGRVARMAAYEALEAAAEKRQRTSAAIQSKP